MKTSFILHLDSLDVLNDLNNEQKAELFQAIYDYHKGNDVKLSGLMKAVFTPFKNQFERDLQKYDAICERNKQNGKTGGRPKNPNKPTGLSGNPDKPIKPDNDSDNDSDNENNKKEYEIKKNQLLGLYNEVKNTASFEGVKMALNSIVNQKLNYDLMANDFINFAITQDKTYKKPIDFSNHFQNYYKTKDLTKYFIIENNNDIDFEKVLEVYNRVFKRNQTYLTNEEKNIVIKAFNDFGKEKINKALEKASKDDFLVDINPQNLSRKFKSFVNIEFLFKYKTLHKYSNL